MWSWDKNYMELSSILVLFFLALFLFFYFSVIDSFACVGDSCLVDGFILQGYLCMVGLDTRTQGECSRIYQISSYLRVYSPIHTFNISFTECLILDN